MPREPDRELHALNETLTQQTAELARTRDALRASEERFRLVVSNIPGAVYRRSLDADMTIEFVSDTAEAITGYAAASPIDSTDGGTLAFETSPGAGTTFTIRLPIAGAQAAAA